MTGLHGVGKTARIMQTAEKCGVELVYFSGGTMDVFVDFIGLPKIIEGAGGPEVLLVRPSVWRDTGKPKLVFIDEFNRAPKKLQNAVFELIQFGSINGLKVPGLQCVWVAVNPSDNENYHVEALDAAAVDRFHVQVEVPYEVDGEYFVNKYGEAAAISATTWWDKLNEKQKLLCSPRRLDYSLDIFNKGGDLRHVLPPSLPVAALVAELSNGSFLAKLKNFISLKDVEGAKKFLRVENNYNAIKSDIPELGKDIGFVLDCLTKERLNSVIAEYPEVLKMVKTFSHKILKTIPLGNPLLKKEILKNPKILIEKPIETEYTKTDFSQVNSSEDANIAESLHGFNAKEAFSKNSKEKNIEFLKMLESRIQILSPGQMEAINSDVMNVFSDSIEYQKSISEKTVSVDEFGPLSLSTVSFYFNQM